MCLASQEQAQLMLDILQGNFTAHKPVTTHDIDPVSGVTGIVSEHINDVDDTILSGIDASSMSYDQVEAAVRAKIGLGTSHTPQVLSDGRTKISSNLASKSESTTFDVSEVTMELTRQSRVMSEAPPLAVLSLLSPSSSSLVSEESALNSLLPTQKGTITYYSPMLSRAY